MTLWPFQPNWRQSVTVSHEFKTDIFTSRSGKEQRRATRTTPRRSLKFTITRAGDDFRRFNATMKSQGSVLLMGDVARFVRLAADPAAGSSVLQVESVPTWLVAGGAAVLADRTGVTPVTVSSISGTSVTLSAPLARTWQGARLQPALTGWLADSVDVQTFGDRTVESSIVFAQDPTTGPSLDSGVPDEIFNDREVLVYRPNHASAITGSFHHPRDIVDFGRGLTATFISVAFGTRIKQAQLLASTQAERDRILGTFLRMKGQRGEFYLPTWEDDFTVVSSTSTTATFAGTMLDIVYQADDVNRVVMLERGDLRWFRRITGSTNDGTNSTLTTDVDWPCPMDAETTVTWAVVCRFATDQLDVELVTDEIAKVQVSVTSLEDLAVSDADKVFAFNALTAWVIDHYGYSASNIWFDDLEGLVDKYQEATT